MLLRKGKALGAAFAMGIVLTAASASWRTALSAGPPEPAAKSGSRSDDAPVARGAIVERITHAALDEANGKVRVDPRRHCVYLPEASSDSGNAPANGVVRIELERGKTYQVEAAGKAFMTEQTGNDADPFPGVVLYYGVDAEDGYAIRQTVLAPGQSVTFRTPWAISPEGQVYLLAFFLNEPSNGHGHGGYTLSVREQPGSIPILGPKILGK